MPEGERFWNPYRWVTVSDRAVEHDVPHYHHRLDGLAGRIWCELEALTPLFVGDGKGQFVSHIVRNAAGGRRGGPQPYLPATSLKGAIRSLAEIIGNAAVPFPKVKVDRPHELTKARHGSNLDVVARMFGYLDGSSAVQRDRRPRAEPGGGRPQLPAFAGLVRFSDAELAEQCTPGRWPAYEVAVGQPKPSHRSFYPGDNRRKLYHHRVKADRLTRPHPGITQTARVTPAPPGTRFRFTVDFENLREEELDLLVYCLVLEEQSTVELSAAALGRASDQAGVTLRGPLRHKLGGAKPHGAGSVHLRITKLEIRTDPGARYRGNGPAETTEVRDGEDLKQELLRRTEPFRTRADQTMRELRAMMIYAAGDPRNLIQYPTYDWFRNESRTGLKPTT